MHATGRSRWTGSWREGDGVISTESSAVADIGYSFTTRFAEAAGVGPEELLAAAHAACFNQALANNLDQVGVTAGWVETVVVVDYGFGDGMRPTISASNIRVVGQVPGATAEQFSEAAARAAHGCSISRVLSCEIGLEARLAD